MDKGRDRKSTHINKAWCNTEIYSADVALFHAVRKRVVSFVWIWHAGRVKLQRMNKKNKHEENEICMNKSLFWGDIVTEIHVDSRRNRGSSRKNIHHHFFFAVSGTVCVGTATSGWHWTISRHKTEGDSIDMHWQEQQKQLQQKMANNKQIE